MTRNSPRKPSKRGPARRRPATGTDFWGTTAVEEQPVATVCPIDDAAAVIGSLGPPPLRGKEIMAERYFQAVYDKAVMLAVALATANGLIDNGDEEDVKDAGSD